MQAAETVSSECYTTPPTKSLALHNPLYLKSCVKPLLHRTPCCEL